MNQQNPTIELVQSKTLEPWERLANAVVIRAVDDYRIAARKLKRDPGNKMVEMDIRSLSRFFGSQWFEVLTNVDGRLLLSRLKKEAA